MKGEKESMKKIVAAIAIDGNVIDKSDYFDDYPFPRLIDFRKNELVISNYYKMQTKDYRNLLTTITYDDVKKITLKVVKRIKGQRITLLNTYYDFEILIITKDQEEWDIETKAIYQIIDGMKRIENIEDVVGIFDCFKSIEEFYDLNEQELKTIKNVNVHRVSNKNDFQKFCEENYEEWIEKFNFENGRLTYQDRNM